MIYDNKILQIRMNINVPPYCFIVENTSILSISLKKCEVFYLSKPKDSSPRVRYHCENLIIPDSIKPYGKFICMIGNGKFPSYIIPAENDLIVFSIDDETFQRHYTTRYRYDGKKWSFSSYDCERKAPERIRYPNVNYKKDIRSKLFAEIIKTVQKNDYQDTIFLKNILYVSNATLAIRRKMSLETRIEELDFSIRTFNTLKRNGINQFGEMKHLNNDIKKKLPKRCLIEIEESLKNTFDGFEFTCGGIKATYTFTRFNIDKISNVILEALMNNKTKGKTIFDVRFPDELFLMLIFKGYLYIEDIKRDFKKISDDLKNNGYTHMVYWIEAITGNDDDDDYDDDPDIFDIIE